MRSRAIVAALAVLSLTACSDNTAPTAKGPSASRRIITPAGTLDQNIDGLLALFPKGLATAGRNRWGNVKAKYQEGLTKPEQMKVAQKMLFNLAEWVRDNSAQMTTPPNGETTLAASARLTLYMAQYIHDGPAAEPPPYLPTADNAVALITPSEPDTVVTPQENAGVAFESGSVATETIVLITENPTPYPENCSGPLQTKLCQYPRFYHFSQYPHVRLLKAATFSVCHVNDGTQRTPLADHDRFRLAHTKPANPADYTPGSTIVDDIEILPYVTQTFALCGEVDYEEHASAGLKGMVTRLASGIGKLVTPKTLHAIDQGGGGEAFMFSDFNNVDPDGVPDDSVEAMTVSNDTTHANDHVVVTYTVRNNGTATAPTVPAAIAFSSNGFTAPPFTMVLTSVPVPALAPGETVTLSTEVVIPPSAMAGSGYSLSVSVGSDPAFPDANPANNARNKSVVIDPAFSSIARNWNASEASACALTSSSATYCWGDNTNWQYGAAGSAQSSPFQSTPLQLGFVEMARGPASQFYCGIKADRSAVCWGRNGFGQLGRGVQGGFQSAPATVNGGVAWREMTTGRLSACGVSTTGVGYCWGSNQRGEVGRASVPLGTPPGGNTPATMTFAPAVLDGGHTWKSVVAGWLHACGITTSGAAYCWGDNARGQLGIGVIDNDTTHRSPAPVVGGLQFIQLSLGATHTCGITTDHRAYCWGENFTGQVGVGTSGAAADVGTPTLVSPTMRFSYIAAGSDFGDGSNVTLPPGAGQAAVGHTCALTESGAAWCWGWNGAGQLGNGTTVDSNVPVPVAPGLKFTSLSLGGSATCGRRGTQIWCWGGNQFGQLGIGTATNTATPAIINSPFGPMIL